jgi:hypothetical protein
MKFTFSVRARAIVRGALWSAFDLAALWIDRGEDIHIARKDERCWGLDPKRPLVSAVQNATLCF